MNEVINKIKNLVKDNIVVVACSTGADSMCLLNLCEKALNKEQIVICHVNHKVREQSEIEEIYLKEYAHNNNIKLYIKHLASLSGNFEESARNMRYSFFYETALSVNAKYILVAHNATDNLETIIMRMIKGSSLIGYAGIMENAKYQDIDIYRPLLEVSKKDIISYCEQNNIKYFHDHTNDNTEFTRNRIRHSIIPLLENEKEDIYKAITYFSNTIINANSLLEEKKIDFISKSVLTCGNTRSFKLSEYLLLSDYLRHQILFRLLKKEELSISANNELVKLITSNKSKFVNKLKYTTIIKEYGMIVLYEGELNEDFFLEISEEGTYNLPNNCSIIVDSKKCTFISNSHKIWYNINKLPLIVRSRIPGDKIKRSKKSFDTNEKHFYTQSISDILTNKKIPYIERANTLLLECDNEIIAILGLKIN